jgi:Flp pilus assembly pilin Flp
MIQYLLIRLRCSKLGNDQRGVTTVEYAIMLAMVALVVAGLTPGIADKIKAIFTATGNALNVPQ